MAALINRSISMVSNGFGSTKTTSHPVIKTQTSIMESSSTTASESPLKVFVLAKKTINEIFGQIGQFVDEAKQFVANSTDEVVTKDQLTRVDSFIDKVVAICDVLRRDHMKVAFFGRTSNGKSSVINAVLHNKILPSGLGHTTNCFLQVEGTDEDEPFIVVDDNPNTRLNIESVQHLANALTNEKMGDSTLVRVYWPKNKCSLLSDDVVLVDSPGIDVSANLDEWIDKHCLDADVFVLVSNSESTLMRAEKNFFHKVNEKLSKPNIFILNNRWDASAAEPENQELVRKQHMTRDIDFLSNELNVVDRHEAEDRVFFVSAKEVLQTRLQQSSVVETAGTPSGFADGYQLRYFEFEDFEQKFEQCLSHTALKTKFAQHTKRGQRLATELASIMDTIERSSQQLITAKCELRKELNDKLEFIQQQIQLLTNEAKHQICHLVEQVEVKVSAALNEEIRRLSLLVNDFDRPFSSDSLVLGVYKKELHSHVERGLGSNLRARLSSALSCNVESAQKEMIERVMNLLPPNDQYRQHYHSYSLTPRQNFEILYRINCESLCSDFQEDLEFRFSFGLIQMIQRFTTNSKDLAKKESLSSSHKSLPSTAPQTPSNSEVVMNASANQFDALAVIERISHLTSQSHTTVGMLAVSGILVRTIGWRLIAITGSVYGLLYVYERLTWTNRAKESTFKKQYVNHSTRKLKLIVDLTSANCSHQVQQELSSTFARLCHLIDEVMADIKTEMKQLDEQIRQLSDCSSIARRLKNKANYLNDDLSKFTNDYLKD
ncbi:transmembrane GTPase Marf-like [Oppia nitens]|uniref:transmembrane GTPase Marf-like n=1 Tax=Oppia nitens TaxID=1686743 RepID=UPI0023DC0AB3|nr:transmembrane GTPase Marf-like [Oppia nitens]